MTSKKKQTEQPQEKIVKSEDKPVEQAIQQPAKPDSKIKKHSKKIKIGVIAGGILGALLLVAAIFLLIVQPSALRVDPEAEDKIREIMTSNASNAEMLSVKSSLGFEFSYDKKSMTATGQAMDSASNSTTYSAQTYTDDEMKTTRSYVIVQLDYRDSDVLSESDESMVYKSARPNMTIGTSRVKNYFDRSTMPDKYKDTSKYSDLDLMLVLQKQKLDERGSDYSVSDLKFDGREYKVIDEKLINKFNNSSVVSGHSYTYLTVQNGRPYTISIGVVRSDRAAEKAELDGIIRNMKFSDPTDSELKGTTLNENREPQIRLANSADSSAIDDTTTNTPAGYVSSASLIKVVARNQIATVRVGVYRCADTTYKAENGATMTLTNLCTGGTGSGSIISKDGYVATNGHVASLSDGSLFNGIKQEQVGTYLDFVVQAGYVTDAELQSLVASYRAGDDSALEKIISLITLVPDGNISTSNDKTTYILQTSNDPIRYSSDSGWQYNDTNIEAKLVDSEVDLSGHSFNPNSSESDVAILKASGSFPALTLGDASKVNSGDDLTAIGYPASVDGGLDTKQSTTVPSVTQGQLGYVINVAGGNNVMYTTVQIASGNSGGPTLNSDGEQVGLNTYGGASCDGDSSSSDNSCFGYGVARDIEDLKEMAKANSVSIDPDGELTKLWTDGLSDFAEGKYSSAAKYFSDLNQKYPNNYLVEKFLSVAQSTPDTATPDSDLTTLSMSSDISPIVVVLFVVGVIVLILTVVGVILLVVYSTRKPKVYANQPYYGAPQQQPQYAQALISPQEINANYQTQSQPQPQPQPQQTMTTPEQTYVESSYQQPTISQDAQYQQQQAQPYTQYARPSQQYGQQQNYAQPPQQNYYAPPANNLPQNQGFYQPYTQNHNNSAYDPYAQLQNPYSAPQPPQYNEQPPASSDDASTGEPPSQNINSHK